ncbi:MAG: LytTR family transcriptional regulator DNA-binding domain-containing protein [Bacteroidota bacterium]|nr:LytTR family transcriptional regulator DNA-binding domain-containing protein [Bacteroidota bacterium]
MKAVIVEDELVATQNLQRLINQVDTDIQVIAVLQSVEECIEWFSLNATPDVVFMDIHLADGSAFSIFEKVQIPCPIIFTTAYDEYALKAFEVNSIDYLLKPINQRSLEHAVTKLKSLVTKNTDNADMVASVLAAFKQMKKVYKSNFLIPYKDKFIPLTVDKIACFYTENKIAKIITMDNEIFTVDSSLEDLYTRLDPSLFFRANRQYIISHKAIKDVSVWFGSKVSINLFVTTPDKIIVSKARVAEFKAWYTT